MEASEEQPRHEFAIDPPDAAKLVESGEAQLIDVREPHEWEAGRIPGAVHINLLRLSERAGEIDKDRKVIFQCHVGNRSSLATDLFRVSGYEAYNLEGGIAAWVEDGLPLDPPDGEVVGQQLPAAENED
jgi:rhodanese-related sulfurtransferase